MCHATAVNGQRIGETRDQFARLKTDFQKWLENVRQQPFGSLIDTPLTALDGVLGKTIELIEGEFKPVNEGLDKGTVYELCRQIDGKVIWTRRLWDCYREKIDQRGPNRHRGLVEAADEVAWSCFRPALEINEKVAGVVPGASPLPYVENFYSPRAFMADVSPEQLESREDQTFVEKYLPKMPIPLVGVPLACVESPWLLVTVSHEIGHHVQHQILSRPGLVEAFKELLTATVRQAASDKPLPFSTAADRWRSWSKEIYADLYAITQLGEAVAWSIHESIYSDAKGTWKWKRTGSYPSPGVRQAILRQACDVLKIAPDPAYGDWRTISPVPQDPESVCDLGLVPAIVAPLLNAKLLGLASLADLAKTSLPSPDRVKTVSKELAGADGHFPEGRGEEFTREVLCGGVRAAACLVDVTLQPAPLVRRQNLARNLPVALVNTRQSTLRADEPEINTEAATKAIWDLLKSETGNDAE